MWNTLLDSIGPKESLNEQKAEKEIKEKLKGWNPEMLSLKLILCLEEGLWSLAEEKMTKNIKNIYARLCTKQMFKLATRLTKEAKKLNPKYHIIVEKHEMEKIYSKFCTKIIPRVQKAKKHWPLIKDIRAQGLC